MKMRVMAVVLLTVFGGVGRAFADEVVDGRFGPGALYRMVRPTVWNGSLLLYAHGFVTKADPVRLPPEAEQLTAQFASLGFAIAYSSFSENGWAVKDGAQRTHQLLGLFSDRFGAPSRVYLVGVSMGGLIAIKLQEQFPGRFDGVVTACGVAGGARRLFDYYAHTRALFDVLYRDVLPGDAGNVDVKGMDIIKAISVPATAAMLSNPAGALTIAAIDQTPVPYATPTELLTSIATALASHANSFVDLAPELHGKPYFGNRGVQYTSAVLPPLQLSLLNAAVERFDAAQSALNYMDQYYEPAGDLDVPMIMVSVSRDPVVPAFNQASYLARVTAAGHSNLLVQRTVDGYGHCAVSPQQVAKAIGDLVVWVEFGLKPAP